MAADNCGPILSLSNFVFYHHFHFPLEMIQQNKLYHRKCGLIATACCCVSFIITLASLFIHKFVSPHFSLPIPASQLYQSSETRVTHFFRDIVFQMTCNLSWVCGKIRYKPQRHETDFCPFASSKTHRNSFHSELRVTQSLRRRKKWKVSHITR